MRSKVKGLLKSGLSEEKLQKIGNKEVSSQLEVNEYIKRLEAEGVVEKKNGQYQFCENHHYMG